LVIISASADLDPTIAATAEGIGGAVMIITTAGKSTDDLEPLRAPSITVLEAGAALPRAELVPAASRPCTLTTARCSPPIELSEPGKVSVD
jgi:hypothetical protein